ncbi:MAG: SH3 domain-containing protein [Lachnospiraceae bacterium]|nr:SH3 domain-containing protein [Lachnospiraceae bacterium]
MKRTAIIALLCTLVIGALGCGNKGGNAVKNPESVEETAIEEKTVETDPLSIPIVKDGVRDISEDAILVRFEWNQVNGADGYEVSEESKFCEEETYREPELSEVSENFFVSGAQDDFDFRIKVRAFRGTGDKREYSDWSDYATGSTYDKENLEDDEVSEEDQDTSPFLLWEYEGYVDECKGYTWQKDFIDCDYDGDGKKDRVNRSCDAEEQTAVYTVEFGNGDKIVVPKGWDTGFPHIQGGDLDGDGINEILVTLSYDTSTDPYSFGDMWLFDKDDSTGEYSEVKLPLANGQNGAKGFNIEYDKPENDKIRFYIKDAGYSKEEAVGEDYISGWWTNETTKEFRSVYWAKIREDGSPTIRCYIKPFTRWSLSLAFNLNYKNGKYEIGYLEIDEPDDYGIYSETSQEDDSYEGTIPEYIIYVKAPDGYANLRTGPGTEYDIICQLSNDEQLEVYREDATDKKGRRWLKVAYLKDVIDDKAEWITGWIAESQVE